MKKLSFAIQGLIIVAMFPVYMILEINHHAKNSLSGKNKNSTVTIKAEKAVVHSGNDEFLLVTKINKNKTRNDQR